MQVNQDHYAMGKLSGEWLNENMKEKKRLNTRVTPWWSTQNAVLEKCSKRELSRKEKYIDREMYSITSMSIKATVPSVQ